MMKARPPLLDVLLPDTNSPYFSGKTNSEDNSKTYLYSLQDYQNSIYRDLDLLLNTNCLFSLLQELPQSVRQSTLNYGVPTFCGHLRGAVKNKAFQQALTQTVIHFEPRLIPASVCVELIDPEQLDEFDGQKSLRFCVEASIDMQPAPQYLRLEYELDTDNGRIQKLNSKLRMP